jgi:DNA-binding PadR family transcriptional regulator
MSADEFRITTTVARVLRAFLEDPIAPRYGFDLMRTTRLASGTLYPILARLERLGLVTSQSEVIDPTVEGRRPRKFYNLTADGLRIGTRELAALNEELRLPVSGVLEPGGGLA